jgi:Dehydrogenases with different specificities (related to short-chain alcohol dehydrogenases)
MTDKQWETMLAVHNTAPFQLVRAAAPYFRVKDQEPRVVINISSTSGVHGNACVPDIQDPAPTLSLSQRPTTTTNIKDYILTD